MELKIIDLVPFDFKLNIKPFLIQQPDIFILLQSCKAIIFLFKKAAGSEPKGAPRILKFKNVLVAHQLMNLIHQSLLSSAF